ncbi:HAD family hydrolase [Rheinheimera sp.]|uniref:HAD family hydrolase n=1 Tax=Rheinheimera sp. TaxID=1869214 RepID=UPI0025EE3F0D|nr:HAD family hydrolase [Rheinheimera sp.]
MLRNFLLLINKLLGYIIFFEVVISQFSTHTRLGQHRGIIFDLDGTLVDSQLDFALLCRLLGWPEGTAILEHLATLAESEQQKARHIIEDFELSAAAKASWMPGAAALLQLLKQRSVPSAILTRNTRKATLLCAENLGLEVDLILTRDDCAAKPDPAGLQHIAAQWQMPCTELLFVGDYLFDLQTAANAGMPSCLYRNQYNGHFAASADFVIDHFIELHQLYHR